MKLHVYDALKKWVFTPISPVPLCLYRIAFGLLAFAMGLFWLFDASTWLGNSGVMSQHGRDLYFHSERVLDIVAWLNPDMVGLNVLLVIYLLATLCLTIGFGTRFAAIVVWLLMVSFAHHNPIFVSTGDKLMCRIGFLLIFAPAGKMFSIDNRLATIHGKSGNAFCSPWAQRLIQLQVAILYWHTFWLKLHCPYWINGTAIYYAVMNIGHSRLPLPYLLDHLWTIKVLTWMVLVIEFSFWSLIWVRHCRYWVILMGVLLHLGIAWTMYYQMFSFTMIASYLVFVDPQDLQFICNRAGVLIQSVKAAILRPAANA